MVRMKICEVQSGAKGHQSVPVAFFDWLQAQTPEMIISYKTPAFLAVALAISDAFSISRRAFLVDTTMSCSDLVWKSWLPLAIDNIEEEAIQDLLMLLGDSNSREKCLMISSRQLIRRNSTEQRCI
jgi:hypothetical protein